MPAHDDGGARRGWRIVFVVVHLAFMIGNASALVSTARQRTRVEAF